MWVTFLESFVLFQNSCSSGSAPQSSGASADDNQSPSPFVRVIRKDPVEHLSSLEKLFTSRRMEYLTFPREQSFTTHVDERFPPDRVDEFSEQLGHDKDISDPDMDDFLDSLVCSGYSKVVTPAHTSSLKKSGDKMNSESNRRPRVRPIASANSQGGWAIGMDLNGTESPGPCPGLSRVLTVQASGHGHQNRDVSSGNNEGSQNLVSLMSQAPEPIQMHVDDVRRVCHMVDQQQPFMLTYADPTGHRSFISFMTVPGASAGAPNQQA